MIFWYRKNEKSKYKGGESDRKYKTPSFYGGGFVLTGIALCGLHGMGFEGQLFFGDGMGEGGAALSAL